MYYSCQWNDSLIRIFSDTTVVIPRHATPVLTLQQIRNSVHEWISRSYAWGLDLSSKLSLGYILPQLSSMFRKTRSIINCGTSWARKLGQAIGTALFEILNVVYSDLLKLHDVHVVLEQIRILFQNISSDERVFYTGSYIQIGTYFTYDSGSLAFSKQTVSRIQTVSFL